MEKNLDKPGKELKISKANTNESEDMPLTSQNNPVKEIMQLYEENKLLKGELQKISRLDYILNILNIGGWDKEFEQFLRVEVKKVFAFEQNDFKEDKDSE